MVGQGRPALPNVKSSGRRRRNPEGLDILSITDAAVRVPDSHRSIADKVYDRSSRRHGHNLLLLDNRSIIAARLEPLNYRVFKPPSFGSKGLF
jgi:hypothetical protein